LTKVFKKLYNPFMPKKATTRRTSAPELKKPIVKAGFKLPLNVKLKEMNWKKFSSTQVLVALLVIAAFLIGVLFTKVQYLEKNQTNPQQAAVPSAQTNPQQAAAAAPVAGAKVNVDPGHFPIRGNKDAKVTIIEFADFRCPFCEQYFTNTESQIIKDYVDTGKVKLAFRNFAFLGPASVTAADAAECANDQGKFWDYYEYLYKNQPSESDTSMYNTDTLTQAAVSLGINGDTFKTCLDSKADEAKTNKDLADGQKAGVSGTPSFFVNGISLVGAEPYSAFKTIIDQELAKAK
jgi:protein-disulfide isomerase